MDKHVLLSLRNGRDEAIACKQPIQAGGGEWNGRGQLQWYVHALRGCQVVRGCAGETYTGVLSLVIAGVGPWSRRGIFIPTRG